MRMNNLSRMQLDVLREIGNIGAGNAATSMSELLNKKINMQIPSVNIVSFDEMMNLIGGPDNVIVAIYFRVQGEAPGKIGRASCRERVEKTEVIRSVEKETE